MFGIIASIILVVLFILCLLYFVFSGSNQEIKKDYFVDYQRSGGSNIPGRRMSKSKKHKY